MREDETGLPAIVPPRAPLPEGVPNYVTANGLAQMRDELAKLDAEQERAGRDPNEVARTQALAAITARKVELEHRIANAELVVPPAQGSLDEIRFGATVAVQSEVGMRQYSIVGVDEADAARGKIAFVSPLARALLGRSVGDVVQLRTPRGEEMLRITSVHYDTN
jgi:transcription elongation factor GreB